MRSSNHVRRTGKLRGHAVVLGGLIVVAAGVALADDTRLSPADQDFLGKAAQGGRFEVTAGKLAQSRALDPNVRTFAQQMVFDHTRLNDSIRALGDAHLINLPKALTSEDQTSLGQLQQLTGSDFDRQYVQIMAKDHVADIQAFESEAKTAKADDIKAFAQDALPTLRHHLMTANQLAGGQKSP